MYPDNLEITPRMRKGTVLNRANFGCLGGIPTLNITNGCLFSCAYCYARGYSQAPRGKEVQVYVNLPELLEKELPRKRQVPSWVIINTASDCFQPHPDILRVAFETMRILLDWGVGVSILTKGEIPGKFLDLFRRNPGKVLAQVGLVSLSERYWRDYEPYAAHPEVRIRNLFHLRDLGITPEVRMDPIIPFVTDTENEVAGLLERVKEAGVHRVSLSYLHLRPPIRDQLIRELSPLHRKLLEACFHGGDWKVVGSSTMTKLLPPLLREKGYDRIRGIAKKVGSPGDCLPVQKPGPGRRTVRFCEGADAGRGEVSGPASAFPLLTDRLHPDPSPCPSLCVGRIESSPGSYERREAFLPAVGVVPIRNSSEGPSRDAPGPPLARILAERVGAHEEPPARLAGVGHVFFHGVGSVVAGLAGVLGHLLQLALAGVGGVAGDAGHGPFLIVGGLDEALVLLMMLGLLVDPIGLGEVIHLEHPL